MSSTAAPSSLKPLLAGGAIAGATLMYLLDPDRGRRRRAIARDKINAFAHRTDDTIRMTARDFKNRAQGMIAEAKAFGQDGDVPDDILAARVRSKLGFLTSHPKPIGVEVVDGRVILTGPILARDIEALIAGVRRIRGVRDLGNRLEVHEKGDIPSLQGESTTTPQRWDVFQRRWSPTTRLLAGIAGTALALYAVRHHGARASTAGMLGGASLLRAMGNRSHAGWR